jgi:hypothetical protein
MWLGERVRLPAGSVGIADWPPSLVALVGWATVVVWAIARGLRHGGGQPGRGFWIAGAWATSAVVVGLALATLRTVPAGTGALSRPDLAELINWALLYAALFTVAVHQLSGSRARRAALVLAAVLVLALLPITITVPGL